MKISDFYEFVVYPAGYKPDKHQYFSFRTIKAARKKATDLGVSSQIWAFANIGGNPYWFKHILTRKPHGFLLKDCR